MQVCPALACLLQIILQDLKHVHLLDCLLQLQVVLVNVDQSLARHAAERLWKVKLPLGVTAEFKYFKMALLYLLDPLVALRVELGVLAWIGVRHPDGKSGLYQVSHLRLHHLAEPVEGEFGVAGLVSGFLQELNCQALLGQRKGTSCTD